MGHGAIAHLSSVQRSPLTANQAAEGTLTVMDSRLDIVAV